MITSPSAPTKGRMVATFIATIALVLSACAGSPSQPASTAGPSGPAPTQQAAASDAPSEEPATFAPAGKLEAGELGAPAANGLIAYSSDGDIFVGDPVTGTSTAIVTGPGNDTRPIFSQDGLRIAFLRAESLSDGIIVVVRADGSGDASSRLRPSRTGSPVLPGPRTAPRSC